MSTSRLQQYVKAELTKYNRRFIENYRPAWLTDKNGNRLELDFFLENSKIAIEVQGEQHFVYTSFFHKSPEHFRLQIERDKIKKELCQAMGIYLIEITTEAQVRGVMLNILDLNHKPEALEKLVKKHRCKEIINNLQPNELCLYHAKEIKKYQNLFLKLDKKRNKNVAVAGTVRNALRHVREHRRALQELTNSEAVELATYLLKKLPHGKIIRD